MFFCLGRDLLSKSDGGFQSQNHCFREYYEYFVADHMITSVLI